MTLARFISVLFILSVFCFTSLVLAKDVEMLKKTPGKLNKVPGILTISPESKAQITLKTTACKKNAQDNLAIYNKWKSSGCPDTSGVLGDYNFYYQRCMNDATIDVKERQEMLANCICSKYATTAQKQNKERLDKGCKAKPVSSWWNSDYRYHYNWCVRGGNPLRAEYYTNQRAQILKTGCKKEEKKDDKKTVQKKAVLGLQKQSDPGATFADIPYLGIIPAQKEAKLLTVTNNTKYYMTFLSKFNPSLSAAKCSTIGSGIVQEFKLFPGQSHTFTNESLFAGRSFHVCTDSNKEFSLKLNYEYEVTY